MKNIIAILMFGFLACNSFGQCKYDTNKKIVKDLQACVPDKITKVSPPVFIYAKAYFLSSNGRFFKDDKGEYFFQFNFTINFVNKFNVTRNDKMIMQFENNSNFSLIPINDFLGVQNGQVLEVSPIYKLSKEQTEIFASNPLFYIKFYFSSDNEVAASYEDENGHYFGLKVTAKLSKSYCMKWAACVLQD